MPNLVTLTKRILIDQNTQSVFYRDILKNVFAYLEMELSDRRYKVYDITDRKHLENKNYADTLNQYGTAGAYSQLRSVSYLPDFIDNVGLFYIPIIESSIKVLKYDPDNEQDFKIALCVTSRPFKLIDTIGNMLLLNDGEMVSKKDDATKYLKTFFVTLDSELTISDCSID